MAPITSVTSTTGEASEKDVKPVDQIAELLHQGQEAVVSVKLDTGETGQDYRLGVALALQKRGVNATVLKAESEGDKTLTFRVRKEG